MADNYFANLDRYLAPQEENRFINGSPEINGVSTGGAGKFSAGGRNDPIVPISKLGTTFAEKGGNGQSTILQSMMASIRQGSGQLQLAMQHDYRNPIGGGIGSIGKDQRQAIKELIKASEIDFQGLELPPNSFSNLSGFDPQRGGFSEEKRTQDLQHMKDAILFTSEIGAGGGVDVWSQEFSRNIADSSAAKDGFVDFNGFDENKHAVKTIVDERTGQITQFQTGNLDGQGNATISVPVWNTASSNGVGPDGVQYNAGDYLDEQGNKIIVDANDPDYLVKRVPVWDEKKKEFKSQQMNWSEFKEYTKHRNEAEGLNLSPEVWLQRTRLENQFSQQRGQSLQYSQQYDKQVQELKKLQEQLKVYEELEQGKSEDELIQLNLMTPTRSGTSEAGQLLLSPEYKKKSEIIKESMDDIQQRLKYSHEISSLADAGAKNIWNTIQHIKPVAEFAKEKTFDSYAEMGLFALEQTKKAELEGQPLARAIHVGPELGWPQAYGGHTDEFIEIIQSSRKKMIEKMQQDSRYAQLSNKERKELAEKHISGMLDTSHLSMWYNHFPKNKPEESEESRLKRFNGWYLEQMDKLGKSKAVGSVQIVDSATGDHRHLPVGQGIFPTVDAVKRLQKHGFDGAVVSEGHEEEGSEPGKIQYSLWSAFGANMGTNHHFAGSGSNSFSNIYTGLGGAAGYRAPPNYIVGGYSPSNEWKLWSEVPLE